MEGQEGNDGMRERGESFSRQLSWLKVRLVVKFLQLARGSKVDLLRLVTRRNAA